MTTLLHPATKTGTLNAPRAHTPGPPADAAALESELRSRLQGEVRFDAGSRALYSTDASNYRQIPIGVVVPRTVEDVVETVAACRRHGVPVLSRGGGTSLAGQCCNVAVVLDFSKHLHRLVELDPGRRLARVQPGIVLDDLRHAAEEHGLTFGPDPATHNRCTLGGMIGNNSCGIHSVMSGKTVDNVEELEVLTYDGLRLQVGRTSEEELAGIIRAGGRRGEIYRRLRDLRDRTSGLIRERYPKIPRRVSGYNLDQLLPENGFHVARALVGTECTCVTILESTLRLVPSPRSRVLLVLGFPDIYRAADRVMDVMEHGPIGLEGMDQNLTQYIRLKHMEQEEDLALLPEGHGWLLAELGGETREETVERARRMLEALQSREIISGARLLEEPWQQKRLWEIRESGLGATANIPGFDPTWPGWEDSAAPPERLGGYLRELRQLFERYGYHGAFYGHFGQGCLHVRIDFDLQSREGIARYRAFIEDAADLVVGYGGSLSGEHGDGQARGALLPKMFGDELVQAFREFKAIWDPDWKMNPGKVIDADPPETNLRLGSDYHPWEPATHFHYPEDEGSLAKAALRCVGVGLCRRTEGDTMCPSYMVTLEEKHSTRGRARLLFEMLQRDVIGHHGWHDEEVKEALDLCLACKGCKGDCPVRVDMATYKAEFNAHYYAHRLRPRSAYAFGLIHWWSRLASRMPGVANFVTRTPGLSRLAKAAAGVAPQRTIPGFAARTFRDAFAERGPRGQGRRVLLWPDTFNDNFHPDAAEAAVEVLERAGFRVELPRQHLCCGRPLYDYGMLDLARRHLRQILDALRDDVRAGTPLVVLEPSCAATFFDELPNLFPHDEDARRLSKQTFLLSEFLLHEGITEKLPRLQGKALLHGHCHHKSLRGMDADKRVLAQMGLEVEVPDTGCCGMAGAFGFEAGERYEVAVRCGERVLLPAVRDAARQTLIIADGFSCREQIEQGTGRQALHLAQVLQLAQEGPQKEGAAPGEPPERGRVREPAPPNPAPALALAALGGWMLGSAVARGRRGRQRKEARS